VLGGVLLTVGLSTVSARVAAAAPQDSVLNLPVVVTSGDAVVTVVPDRAYVTLTAESRASSPREAQKQNAAAMSAVQDRLRNARVPKDAIRTTHVDLQQEFDYKDGRQVPRGFLARHGIELRLDEIDRAGDVIDAGVAAGATSVGNIRFDLKDRDKAEREALRLAVLDARARADALASGAGKSVDRVIRIEETRDFAGPRPMPMATAMRAEPSTPVSTGELEIRARVVITVSLR
jgi:uncharacterized protein YggE